MCGEAEDKVGLGVLRVDECDAANEFRTCGVGWERGVEEGEGA